METEECLREICRLPSIERVDMVEIDGRVVESVPPVPSEPEQTAPSTIRASTW